MFAFRRSYNTFSIHEDRKLKIDPDWLSFLLRFNWEVYLFKNFFTFIVFSLSLSINVEKVYQRLLWCRSTGKCWPAGKASIKGTTAFENTTLYSQSTCSHLRFTHTIRPTRNTADPYDTTTEFFPINKSHEPINQSIYQFYLKSLRGIKVALSIQAGGSCMKRTTKIKLKSKMRLKK